MHEDDVGATIPRRTQQRRISHRCPPFAIQIELNTILQHSRGMLPVRSDNSHRVLGVYPDEDVVWQKSSEVSDTMYISKIPCSMLRQTPMRHCFISESFARISETDLV